MIDYISFLGILLSIIAIKFIGKKNRHNVFLGAFYFTLSTISFFRNTIFFIKNDFLLTIIAPISIPLFYAAAPLLFLYIKYLFQLQEYQKFKKIEWLHFLPVILVFINFSPQLFISTKEKAVFFEMVFKNPQFLNETKYFIFSIRENLLIRPLYFVIYIIASLSILFKNRKMHEMKNDKNISIPFISILITLFSLQTLIILGVAIALNFGSSINQIDSEKTNIIASIQGFISFTLPLIIFLFPHMLYGILGPLRNELNKSLRNKYFAGGIAIEKTHLETSIILEKYFISKPYLQTGYNMSILAFDTKIPCHQIAKFFNIYLERTFSDWKNAVRIEYAIEQMHEGKALKITLEAISINCGYTSRSNFNKAFEKITGQKPSEYIKNLRNIPLIEK